MFTSSISIEALLGLTKGKDTVCEMEVEAAKAAGLSIYNGKTYYFCGAACKQAFDRDSDKYAHA